MEMGVEDSPEASCAIDRVGRGHRFLAGHIANEGCCAIDRVVTAWIDELRSNRHMERGADTPHVIAVDRNARSYLNHSACGGSLYGLSCGTAQPLTESKLSRGAFKKPGWRKRSAYGNCELGSGQINNSRWDGPALRERMFIVSGEEMGGAEALDPSTTAGRRCRHGDDDRVPGPCHAYIRQTAALGVG